MRTQIETPLDRGCIFEATEVQRIFLFWHCRLFAEAQIESELRVLLWAETPMGTPRSGNKICANATRLPRSKRCIALVKHLCRTGPGIAPCQTNGAPQGAGQRDFYAVLSVLVRATRIPRASRYQEQRMILTPSLLWGGVSWSSSLPALRPNRDRAGSPFCAVGFLRAVRSLADQSKGSELRALQKKS
jgi:hypothetical protein